MAIANLISSGRPRPKRHLRASASRTLSLAWSWFENVGRRGLSEKARGLLQQIYCGFIVVNLYRRTRTQQMNLWSYWSIRRFGQLQGRNHQDDANDWVSKMMTLCKARGVINMSPISIWIRSSQTLHYWRRRHSFTFSLKTTPRDGRNFQIGNEHLHSLMNILFCNIVRP